MTTAQPLADALNSGGELMRTSRTVSVRWLDHPVATSRRSVHPTTRRYRPGSSTLRQVTQPSSFSNSLMSTTTGVKPRSSRSPAVRGADAAISTRSPPSGTTWEPLSPPGGPPGTGSPMPASVICRMPRSAPSARRSADFAEL